MMTVTLPVVSATLEIWKAIDVAHNGKVSAVVVEGAEPRVVVLAELVAALRIADSDEAKVAWCLELVDAKRTSAKTKLSTFVENARTYIGIPEGGGVLMLPEGTGEQNGFPSHTDYHVKGMSNAKAVVETRHEWIGTALATHSTLCRCSSGNRRHVFEPYEVKRAGYCNYDSKALVCS